MLSDDYQVVIKPDRVPSGEHERRFNSPTINEVAIVMVGTEHDPQRAIVPRNRLIFFFFRIHKNVIRPYQNVAHFNVAVIEEECSTFAKILVNNRNC